MWAGIACLGCWRSIACWSNPSGRTTRTTHSFHRFYRHPNLLKPGPQQVLPCAPEQVWVADITYLPSLGGPLYLSLVTDAYSRKIVGHHVHDSLHAESVARAYSQALRYRTTRNPLVHHSDRGIQYCSGLYQRLHVQHGATCSMTDGYDWYQNARAERVNGILKNELLEHPPADLGQARRMVREAVDIYNRERPHPALRSGAWPERCKPISGLDIIDLSLTRLQVQRSLTYVSAVLRTELE